MKTYKIEIKTEADIFNIIKGVLLDNFKEFKLEEGDKEFNKSKE